MSAGDEPAAGAAVRAAATRRNAAVVADGESLAQQNFDDAGLTGRDRALARAMLVASIRWHHRHEWQLTQLLDRPLRPKDRLLAALLRVGLSQIESLRIPDHAAVSATVAAAGVLGLRHARGLVNAVLRRFLREQATLADRADAVESARFSHPDWLIAELRRDWPGEWQSILEANNAEPPIWLRVNRLRIGREAYLQQLADADIRARADAGGPDGIELLDATEIESLPGFAAGLVSVQDTAAQRAAGLLGLAPGQRVLDACAAPGGKAAHILERCPEIAALIAVDNDAARLERARSNLTRLGLEATLVTGDAGDPDAWFDGQPFDRILLDAPCTGTGVIRRHPDIKILRRAEDAAAMAERQGALLDALWPLLAPGGLLVYVTCSVLETENRRVTDAFAGRAADADLAVFGSAGHFQRLPGEANGDGFYYACLRKGTQSYK